MQEPKKSIISLKGSISETSSVSSSGMSIATSFSQHYIHTAVISAQLSAKIEENNRSNPSEEIIIENTAYVTEAIFASVSFLESTINEFFWKSKENPREVEVLGSEIIEKLAEEWRRFEKVRRSTLNKYKIALDRAEKIPFDENKSPYLDVSQLITLRNALIHYKPEFIKEKPHEIENQLKGKFNLNPFFADTSQFFPHRCLSYGCAKWAVTSSINFTDEFFSKMGIIPKYEQMRQKFKLD